jgi:competence CoiA-like predicted nuclease
MQLNSVKLPFGLIDNQLKHITEVSNGRACGCVCPKCKRPLEARNNGKIRAAYFAHYNAQECVGATETAVHLMAKQVIVEAKVIKTPAFNKTPEKRDIEYNL